MTFQIFKPTVTTSLLQIRKMGLWGMLRVETWLNIYKSKQVTKISYFLSHFFHQLGTAGNLEGDGYHLGGVFVLGPGEQV